MRRVWYSVAMSLDGYIAGPSGEYDWIPDEPEIDWGAFMARFDTVLMGRRSYEVALQSPNAGAMPGMATYVVSSTLRADAHPDVTILHEDLEARLAALRAAPGKEIWLFGGGVLFRSLLERGQVDMVEIGLVPVLLGAGIPFLPGLDGPRRLELTETRRYPSGILLSTYATRRESTPSPVALTTSHP